MTEGGEIVIQILKRGLTYQRQRKRAREENSN
jgi:hypothetical protein